MFRAFVFVACAPLVVVGCSGPTNPTAAVPPKAAANHDSADAHAHETGAHGGALISVGRDAAHLEAVLETGGALRLFTLGRDETRVEEIVARPVKAFAKAESDATSTPIEFVPEPQDGDQPGMSSAFVAKLPAALVGKTLEIAIPSLLVQQGRFRVAFRTAGAAKPEAGHGMPAGVADSDEAKLYLTPGGKYTAADIRANGGVVASVKFKGIRADHDAKPKPGDRLCPISMTKANPKFVWVIDGKSYEFCCPPCVDEFVQTAKDRPDQLQDPSKYIQK